MLINNNKRSRPLEIAQLLKFHGHLRKLHRMDHLCIKELGVITLDKMHVWEYMPHIALLSLAHLLLCKLHSHP